MPDFSMEEQFPRGGEKSEVSKLLPNTNIPKSVNKKRKRKSTNAGGEPEHKKLDNGEELEEEEDETSVSIFKSTLRPELCTPGLLALGVVSRMDEDHMTVEMADGRVGVVECAHVSREYRKHLMQCRTNNTEPVPLSKVFTIGQRIICCVIDKKDRKSHDTRIYLSTCASQVNNGVRGESLTEGVVVWGNVHSVEDKGYSISTGVDSIMAFLPLTEVDKGTTLSLGTPITCVVRRGPTESNRVVDVSAKSNSLNIQPGHVVADQIIPGTFIQSVVQKYTPKGCVVRVSPHVVGFVPLKMLSRKQKQACRSSDESMSDMQLDVVVTFCKPNSQILGLSALSHLISASDIDGRVNIASEYPIGTTVNATVTHISPTGTLHFNIDKKRSCIAARGQLNMEVPEEGAYEIVLAKYPTGKQCKVRVIGLSMFDQLIFVSLDSHVLKQKIVSAEQATFGMHLNLKVTKVNEKGLMGTVYDKIPCRVSINHITDTRPKQLTKIIKIGHKLNARVLDIDREKRRLVLTVKPTLIRDEGNVVSSNSDLKVGMVILGVVVFKDEKGILVTFYGDAKAFCPKQMMEKSGFSAALIALGHVLKVRVMSISSDGERVVVQPAFDIKKEMEEEETPLKLGHIYQAKVIENRCENGNGGLRVSVVPDGIEAWLPETQLTDCSFDEIGIHLAKSFKKGDVINDVTLVSLLGPCPVVSSKPLVASHMKAHTFPDGLGGLSKGMLLMGTVQSFSDTLGYMIQLPSAYEPLVGLCPLQQAPHKKFAVGQTILAKVSKVDPEKGRFSVTLKGGKSTSAYVLLKETLLHRERGRLGYAHCVNGSLAALSELTIGQVVDVKIDQVSKVGCTCTLQNMPASIKGIVTADYIHRNASVGELVRALVVFVDFTSKCVELVTDKNVMKRIAAIGTNRDNLFTIGNQYKAQVLSVKKDRCVVLVTGDEFWVSAIGYLPTRTHLNSAFGDEQTAFTPNDVIDEVTLKEILPDGSLILHNNANNINSVSQLNLGDMCHASVIGEASDSRGGESFMLLDLPSGQRGRIHATEVADKFEDACDPFEALYKFIDVPGPHIKVRIMGHHTFRDNDTEKNKYGKMKYFECTMKPSKMAANKKPKKSWLNYRHKLNNGDIVIIIAEQRTNSGWQVRVNPVWEGFVPKRYMPSSKYVKGGVYTARVLSTTVDRRHRRLVLTMKHEHMALPILDLALICVKKEEYDINDCVEELLTQPKEEEEQEFEFEHVVNQPTNVSIIPMETEPAPVSGTGFQWSSNKFSLDRLMNVGLGSDVKEEESDIPVATDFVSDTNLISHNQPQKTEQEFDKELLGCPNNSKTWISFMAHYLHKGNVKKARAVAERALKTINYREDKELQNLWVAYLNVENSYGTNETLQLVFERALKGADDLAIHKQMVDIYQRTGKIEKASALLETIVKRYSDDVSVWVMAGEHHLNHGQPDKARDIMHRAIKSLPNKHHVTLLSRSAIAEFECEKGDKERGRTLFESILDSYPKRTDLWIVYIDMLTKHCGANLARPVFERATALKLNSHKMRAFYNKWAAFEHAHGTPELEEAVRERAAVYVKHVTETLQ